MDFSKVIVRLRERSGMTQADLAKRLGVSKGTIGAWELGRADSGGTGHGPRLSRLPKIAKALGVTVADLMRGADKSW